MTENYTIAELLYENGKLSAELDTSVSAGGKYPD